DRRRSPRRGGRCRRGRQGDRQRRGGRQGHFGRASRRRRRAGTSQGPGGGGRPCSRAIRRRRGDAQGDRAFCCRTKGVSGRQRTDGRGRIANFDIQLFCRRSSVIRRLI